MGVPRCFRLPPALLFLVAAASCGTTASTSTFQSPVAPPIVHPSSPPATPELRVVFHNGKAFAREGQREWPIADVSREEMLWAPDGQRFAYFQKQVSAQPSSQPASGARRHGRTRVKKIAPPPDLHHVVIRNIRGDPVNEFPTYRLGRPSDLDWIDNNHLGYLAPADETGDVYVLHSVETGEILQTHRGCGFVWSPGKKRLAFVTGKKRDQSVRVGDLVVWPRPPDPGKRSSEKSKKKANQTIISKLVWSPDGNGLAFLELSGPQRNLVVMLVLDNKEGDLTWPLPDGAVSPENHLFWADSKVIIGKSALQPRFAASWKRIR
jgi:hypothetical protein